MSDSRLTSTRRRALKYAGVTGFSGFTALSLTSKPTLAISESVTLPSGLTEGSVDVSSYEIQYAELDTSSDITTTYILRTASDTTTETHTVSITESTGAVMTGGHSISVPAGEVTLEVQLEHPSVGTVSTQESAPTEVASSTPDSVTNRLRMDEGGGTTLNDSVGSLTTSLSGASWTSNSKYTGGYATDYDATDDYWSTDSNININGQLWGVGFWTENLSNPNGYGGLISAYPVGTRNSNGWTVFLGNIGGSADSTSQIVVRHRNGGSNNDAINTSIPDLSSGDYFIGISGNGDTSNLYIWDSSQQQVNTSGSASRGETSDAPLTGMDRNGNRLGGIQDDVYIAQGSEITESEFEQIWQATQR